jgi:hypothetical protein
MGTRSAAWDATAVEQLLEVVANVEDTQLPELGRACVAALGPDM